MRLSYCFFRYLKIVGVFDVKYWLFMGINHHENMKYGKHEIYLLFFSYFRHFVLS